MGNKKQIVFLMILGLLILINYNTNPVQSVEVDWQVGDIHTYGIHLREYYKTIYHQTDKEPSVEDDLEQWNGIFNITAINNVTKVVSTLFGEENETAHNWDHNYGMDFMISEHYSSITGLFGFYYDYSSELDEVVLISISTRNDEAEFFHEPDWVSFNNAIKNNVLNETTVISTVSAWGKSIPITFGEFLNNLTSYRINGKKSISSARELFTSDNTLLSFHFDLRGLWPKGDYDVHRSIIDYSVEYFDNGLLKRYEMRYDIKISDDWSTNEQIYEIIFAYGGVGSINLNLSKIMILPAMVVMVFIIKNQRKK